MIVDGHTGIEREKLDDREQLKQLRARSQGHIEARKQLDGQSQGDDRKQLKGQSQGDQLGAGFLLAMSEDLDRMPSQNACTPTIRRSMRCVFCCM